MPLEIAVTYSNGITGSNTKAGRADTSAVIEFNHKVYIPVDEQMGTPTGTRVHCPVIFVKPIDAASPLLYKACCNGEILDELLFDWYAIQEGAEAIYYSTKLTNVMVSSVEDVLPNTKDPTKEKQVHLERVELRYGDIEWEYKDGGIIHMDSWSQE